MKIKLSILFSSLLPLTIIAEENYPNILFLFADDHAYQAISAYGSNRNNTPNIDRLAKEGMLFELSLIHI